MDYQLSPELREELRALLEENEFGDVTQTELAEQVGFSHVTLSLWLSGHRVAQTPRALNAVRRLCRRVGMKPKQGLSCLPTEKAA